MRETQEAHLSSPRGGRAGRVREKRMKNTHPWMASRRCRRCCCCCGAFKSVRRASVFGVVFCFFCCRRRVGFFSSESDFEDFYDMSTSIHTVLVALNQCTITQRCEYKREQKGGSRAMKYDTHLNLGCSSGAARLPPPCRLHYVLREQVEVTEYARARAAFGD